MTRSLFQAALGSICICLKPDEMIELETLIAAFDQPNISSPQISSARLSMVWAILIGLFYHDRITEIPIALAKYSVSSLTLAYTIALITQPSPQLNRLITDLSALVSFDSDHIAQLHDANKLVQQGQSQAIAEASLAKNSIAFALYVFLSTPTAWQICLKRAAKLKIAVGAIAAIYQTQITSSLRSEDHNQLPSGIISNQLSDRLFSNWAGIPLGIAISDSIMISAPSIRSK